MDASKADRIVTVERASASKPGNSNEDSGAMIQSSKPDSEVERYFSDNQ